MTKNKTITWSALYDHHIEEINANPIDILGPPIDKESEIVDEEDEELFEYDDENEFWPD